MAGLLGLSIDPTVFNGKFCEDLFYGTLYLQHRAEKYCGLACFRGRGIHLKTSRGHLRPAFMEIMGEFEGINGIGYCGLSPEPIFVRSKFGECSLCFAGNIINHEQLMSELMKNGITFESGEDIEIIARLISQGQTIVDGIKNLANKVKGAYSVLILTGEGIYVFVSPNGHWPLLIGRKRGAIIASSESNGFDNLGFSLIRNIQSGEILLLQKGDLEYRAEVLAAKRQLCSFLWVYTAFPNAVFGRIPASLVRKRLGATLARRDIEKGFIPHYVIAVPDSGRFHAIGYHQEFCRQMMLGKTKRVPLFDEFLLKYSAATGRSFTRSTQEKRDREARIKILRGWEINLELSKNLSECWEGENFELEVVVCEDSIVRGTQLQQNLIPKLNAMGIKRVHVRVSNPPLLQHCPWGKTTKKGELLAERIPDIDERAKHLGATSLVYNTVEDLIRAIGLPRQRLCLDCSLP